MRRIAFRLFSVVLLLISSPSAHAIAQDVDSALRTLDGIFSEEERSAATHAILTDEGSFFVQRDDGFLRITVDAEPIGVSSLCIGTPDGVHVLHASAALGSLEFLPQDDGWVTDDAFSWEMRDSSMSNRAIAERAAYFESHGWVATTASMGDPGTTEFLISEELVWDDGVHAAVGVMPMERPDVTLAFPTSAPACADPELVRGHDPDETLTFRLSDWLHIGG